MFPGGVQRGGHPEVVVSGGEPLRQRQRARAHGFRRDELHGDAERLRARGVLLVQGRDVYGGARPDSATGWWTQRQRVQEFRCGGRGGPVELDERRILLQVRNDSDAREGMRQELSRFCFQIAICRLHSLLLSTNE